MVNVKKDSSSKNSMGTDLMKVGMFGTLLGGMSGNSNTSNSFGNLFVAGVGLNMIEGMTSKGKKGKKEKGLLSDWKI